MDKIDKIQKNLEGTCLRCHYKISKGHHYDCPDRKLTPSEELAKLLGCLRESIIKNDYTIDTFGDDSDNV